jgi:hypothetical protein
MISGSFDPDIGIPDIEPDIEPDIGIINMLIWEYPILNPILNPISVFYTCRPDNGYWIADIIDASQPP